MSLMDASLPRPPFEALSHIVRNSQKIVLKELTTATSAAKQLSSTLNPAASASASKASRQTAPAQTAAQADKQLAALIATVSGLKRRLEEMERMAQRQAKGLAVRLEYLAQMERDEQPAGGVAARRASSSISGGEEKRREGERQIAKEMDVEDGSARTDSTAASSSTSNGHTNGHQQHNGSHAAASPSAFTLASIHSITPPPTPSHRLHRLFLDYCLRSSLYRTAAALSSAAASPALASLSDASLFSSLQAVVGGLRARDVSRLLAWCGEWRSRLVRQGSSLEWDARCVDMMEMVKRGERDAAMEYGRKWLGAGVTAGREGGAGREEEEKEATADGDDGHGSSQWDDAVVQERLRKLQEAMTAALYHPLFHPADAQSAEAVLFTSSSSAYHKYSRYWSDERWAELEYQFRLTHLAVHGLPQHSQLALVLYTGMAALKTPYCQSPATEHTKPAVAPSAATPALSSSSSSPPSASFFVQPVVPSSPASSCPVCSSRLLYELSAGLPSTQRSQSCLVCALTGSVMDEHNPPLVLPNGAVYSKPALVRMAQANGGYVTCARTQERYALDECKQAFVL